MTDVKRIAVIGAGTMGHGIAQVSAMAGYETRLHDESAEALGRAMERVAENLEKGIARGKVTPDVKEKALSRLVPASDLQKAVDGADLAIEAIVEDLHEKQILAELLERYLAPEAVIASNTSSISIAEIGSMIVHPERVLGMHFFNPVHILPLVEVVVHAGTSGHARECALAVARKMGKEPIVVKDSPGFASSRLGVALGLEAMRMVEQGVASAEDIDRAMELGYSHPMGPLKVSDLVGLDVRLAIAETLHAALGQAHFAPPEILQRKVAAGELGKKSGRGFHNWTD